MSTRAEAKQQTREALLLAALELFAESGLDEPSLDGICSRAGRTRGAFYVHFDDRGALVHAVVERVLGSYLDLLAETTDPTAGARETVERFSDLLHRAFLGETGLDPFARIGTANFRLVLEASARTPETTALLTGVLQAAVEMLSQTVERDQLSGDLKPTAPPRQLGQLLTVVLLGIVAFPHGDTPSRILGVRDTLLALLGAEDR